MTESARVKELEMQVAEYKKWWDESAQIIRGIQGKCDAQAALVERMRAIANEALDTRLQFGYEHKRALHQIIDAEPSTALQEFKERCWAQGATLAIGKFAQQMDLQDDSGKDALADIVAELRKGGK